jgi:hypothetical protein
VEFFGCVFYEFDERVGTLCVDCISMRKFQEDRTSGATIGDLNRGRSRGSGCKRLPSDVFKHGCRVVQDASQEIFGFDFLDSLVGCDRTF